LGINRISTHPRVSLGQFLLSIWIIISLGFIGLFNAPLVLVIIAILPLLFSAVQFYRRGYERRLVLETVNKEMKESLNAIQEFPDNAAAVEKIGKLFEQLGELSTAKIHYRKALKMHPGDRLASRLETLEKNPNTMDVLYTYVSVVNLCLKCDTANSNLRYTCSSCGTQMYSSYMKWLSNVIAILSEEYSVFAILLMALVLYPFYKIMGLLAFGIVLSPWAITILFSRRDKHFW